MEKKDMTIENIRDGIELFFRENPRAEDDMFVKKLTPEDIEGVVKMTGGLASSMGTELYRLPGGAITNAAGLKMFNDAVKKRFEDGNI